MGVESISNTGVKTPSTITRETSGDPGDESTSTHAEPSDLKVAAAPCTTSDTPATVTAFDEASVFMTAYIAPAAPTAGAVTAMLPADALNRLVVSATAVPGAVRTADIGSRAAAIAAAISASVPTSTVVPLTTRVPSASTATVDPPPPIAVKFPPANDPPAVCAVVHRYRVPDDTTSSPTEYATPVAQSATLRA